MKLRNIVSITSTLILVLLCCVFIPLNSVSAEELPTSFQNFISDSRWSAGTTWNGEQVPKLSSYQGWGCCAYCADFTQYCFGNYNPRSGTEFYDTAEIRAGDVLTVGNQADGTGHWFVCLKRNGNSLYVAEGNYGGKVRIGWNYSIGSTHYFNEDSRYFTAGYHYMESQDESNGKVQFDGVWVWWKLKNGVLTISATGDDSTVSSAIPSDSVVELIIEDGIKSTPEYAFNGYSKLTKAQLPDSCQKTGAFSFNECKQLKQIQMPSTMTNLGQGMFFKCSALEEASVPEGITEITFEVFYGCTSLKKVHLPSTLKKIIGGSFSNTALTDIYYNGTEEDWKNIVFENRIDTPIQNATIHYLQSSVTSLDPMVFEGIPDSVVTGTTFDVTLHEVKNADSYEILFEYVPSVPMTQAELDQINVSQKLSPSDFKNGICELTIDTSDTVNYGTWRFVAFAYRTVPTSISATGRIFSRAEKLFTLLANGTEPSPTDPEEIPENITIDGNCYKLDQTTHTATFTGPEKTSVSKISIPGSIQVGNDIFNVTAIAPSACENLKKLSAVTIGSNVKKIGRKAFRACKKLKTVTGGDGLEEIDDSAFQKCTSLTEILLPANVRKVGKKAYDDCKKLMKITIQTTKLTASTVGANAFKGGPDKVTVYCPKNKLKEYKSFLIKKGISKKAKFIALE